MTEIISLDKVLLNDICRIIDDARHRVAVTANSAMTMMYWHIGDKIQHYVLEGQRATYGQQIVSALSTKLPWSLFMEVLPICFVRKEVMNKSNYCN